MKQLLAVLLCISFPLSSPPKQYQCPNRRNYFCGIA